MSSRPEPFAPADDEARALARSLITRSRHGALAYTDAETGAPGISRIAFGLAPDGSPLTLVSDLAPHSGSLRAHPVAALMLGDLTPKGDPLSHPRLMMRIEARFVAPDSADRAALRDRWLHDHPKSKIYIDFADFAFVRLIPVSALLNGGFGRAHRLTAADLTVA